MFGLTQGVRSAARNVARRSAFAIVASVLLGVGIAFLTVAGWIYLASISTRLTAALVIGFFYFGGGIILLAINWGREAQSHARAEAEQTPGLTASTTSTVPPLVEAFFFGLNAAMQSKGKGGH